MRTLVIALLISLSLGTIASNHHKAKHHKSVARLKVSAPKEKPKLVVNRFVNGKNPLEFKHVLGGETVDEVKAETHALFAMPADFYGGLKGQKCSVDLMVIEGKLIYDGDRQTDPVFIKKLLAHKRSHRPGLVVWEKNGLVEYVEDFAASIQAHNGRLPWQAMQGMLEPPRADESLPRQFWFVKAPYYCCVEMTGTSDECKKEAMRLGADPKKILHGDGGSTLSPGATTPSLAVVY